MGLLDNMKSMSWRRDLFSAPYRLGGRPGASLRARRSNGPGRTNVSSPQLHTHAGSLTVARAYVTSYHSRNRIILPQDGQGRLSPSTGRLGPRRSSSGDS